MCIARLAVLSTVTLALVGGQAFGQAQSDSLEALYPIFVRGHWGLINAAGKEVLPPVYEKIAHWPDRLIAGWTKATAEAAASIDIMSARPLTSALIPVVKDGRAGWATRDGRLLAMGRYDETGEDYGGGHLWMRVGGKVGFADANGETVIAPQFEWVQFHGTPGSSFSHGYAFAKAEGRWGIIDLQGKWIAPPTWDEVGGYTDEDGWTRARLGDRWGVVDRTGQTVIPFRYDDVISPAGPLIFAVDAGRSLYLRRNGSVAFELPCRKGKGFPFFNGKTALVQCGSRWGVIDTLGHFVVEAEWETITGEPALSPLRYRVRSGKKEGVVDLSGNFSPARREVVDAQGKMIKVSSFYDCGDGLAIFAVPAKKSLLGKIADVAKEMGGLPSSLPGWSQVGLADLEGRVVIPVGAFERLECFDAEGMAVARSGGKAGFIDRSGNWVIPPKYWNLGTFVGGLAKAQTPVSKDTNEIVYLNRAGEVVYRMRFSGFVNDEALIRRFR